MTRSPSLNIHTVQSIRKLVLAAAVLGGLVLFAVTSSHPHNHGLHEAIEWVGIGLIIVCVLGRTWTSMYIGGRKIEELVQTGPFSICRNPLYVFSIVGAAGIGCQSGSIILAGLCALLAFAVFAVVVRREEAVLRQRYGRVYADYMARVPRFFPRPSLWHDDPTLLIRPRRVAMTFADALVFLAAYPVAELLEHLQQTGVLPVLLFLA